MPIYEYRCNDCGKVFSKLQRMGATADGVTCPACGSANVERKVSSFASASSGSGVSTGASGSSCSGFT
ncbi:MAG TPA: zinc ribbon domain-containing protein [Acidobacteria bacterium]|nr:zinc ribbon domain-containing protein [Acidobacteriota bacterium]